MQLAEIIEQDKQRGTLFECRIARKLPQVLAAANEFQLNSYFGVLSHFSAYRITKLLFLSLQGKGGYFKKWVEYKLKYPFPLVHRVVPILAPLYRLRESRYQILAQPFVQCGVRCGGAAEDVAAVFLIF